MAFLLTLPWLQIAGGILLLCIGTQLLRTGRKNKNENEEYGSMLAAVRTILLADLVMSLDNVISQPIVARTPHDESERLRIAGNQRPGMGIRCADQSGPGPRQQ
jgi:predicted tellurium resistance membrane protein TerC